MKLAILNNKLPLKAYPQEELNTIVLTNLMPFISALLSLTDEVAAKRLEIALPAIKDHCWSMGFDEIKKMFEMYADNKLAITPVPNYFDRILLGKIFKAYKQQKKKIKFDVSNYKNMEDILLIVTSFDSFIQDGKIPTEQFWIYTYLEEKGVIDFTDEEKKIQYDICLLNKKNNENAIELSKIKLVEIFYRKLYAKNKHIKDLI